MVVDSMLNSTLFNLFICIKVDHYVALFYLYLVTTSSLTSDFSVIQTPIDEKELEEDSEVFFDTVMESQETEIISEETFEGLKFLWLFWDYVEFIW